VLAVSGSGRIAELCRDAGLDLAHERVRGPESGLVTLRGRIGGLDERRVLSGAARTLASAGAMALVAWAFLAALPDLHALVRAVGAAGAGAAAFWSAALLLGVDEAEAVPRMVLARLHRG